MIRKLPPRIRRFFHVVYGITGVAHVVAGIAFAELAARLNAPAPRWIGAAVAALLFAAFGGRIEHAIDDRPMPTWRRLLVEEPYYAHWCAAILSTALFMPALLVLAARAIAIGGDLPIGATTLGTYAVSLAIASWSVLVRRRWTIVRRVDVRVAGLPRAFDGYRVVQLSDLHIGSMSPRERALGWVRTANELDADAIALTGDYVTNGVAFHEQIADVLLRLRAKDGVFAVLGNHDYFGEGEPMIGLLRAGGIRVLRNEHTTIERDGEPLTIAGVDDAWTGRADVEAATRGASRPMIALSHDPKLFPALADRGASLVLSGHTHWGQVGVPFLKRWNVGSFTYRYHAGLYALGDAWLYVNAGLGTTGPPVRLGAAPEITVLTLRRAD